MDWGRNRSRVTLGMSEMAVAMVAPVVAPVAVVGVCLRLSISLSQGLRLSVGLSFPLAIASVPVGGGGAAE